MYDGIYTKYANAKRIITNSNALDIINELCSEIEQGCFSAQNYAFLSKAYSYSGQFKKALEYAKISVKQENDYSYGYARIAYAYAELRNKKKALEYLKIAENLAKDNFYILNLLMTVYNKFNLGDEEEFICNKILNKNNEDPFFWLVKGYCYITLEKFEEALKCYEKVSKIIDNDPQMFNLVAQLYYHSQDYEKSLTNFLKAKAFGANTCHINYKIAFLYNCNKDLQKALEYADIAINLDGDDADANHRKGWMLATLEQDDNALKYLLKAVRKRADSSSLYEGISYLYQNRKDYRKAIKYAEKALLKTPENCYAYYLKGCGLYKLKKYTEAQECFLKSKEYGGKYCDLYTKLSCISSMQGDEENSLKYANKALFIDKNDDIANYRKGRALYLLGNYDEALKYLLKSERLGYIYDDVFSIISCIFGENQDFGNSLAYANKALLMNSEDGYATCLKGFALYNLGKKDAAIKYLQKAKKLGFENVAIDKLILEIRN